MTSPPTRPGRARRLAVSALHLSLALLLTGVGATALHALAASSDAVPEQDTSPPAVRALSARREEAYPLRARYFGRVEASRRVALGFEASGTLESVTVEEGDRVVAGEPLARQDTRRLQAALDRDRAARDALDADLERARLAETRTRRLQAEDFAGLDAMDEARLIVKRLETQARQLDAAITASRIALEKATLTAPFDALVTSRSRDPGALVAAGEPVLQLIDAERRIVRVGVDAASAMRIRSSESHRILIDGEAHAARLLSLGDDLDAATRTVSARFELIDHVPRAGTGVELSHTRSVSEPVFALPVQALVEGDRGTWSVLRVEDGDGGAFVRSTAVDIAHLDGATVWIRAHDRLPDPLRVVASGTHRVVSGERVRVVDTAASLARRQVADERHPAGAPR